MIERGINYDQLVEQEGVRWRTANKCYSFHTQ